MNLKKLNICFTLSILLALNNTCYFHKSFDQNFDFLILHSGEKDVNSNFYQLYNFIKAFFKKWDIKEPLNMEFSIKISNNGINHKRYIIQIPVNYLKSEAQIHELLSLIPDANIRNIIKKNASIYPGAIIYAVDFQEKEKFKVYFDFPKILGIGIDSYEWQNKDKNKLNNRTYEPIGRNFEQYLNKIVPPNQLSAFNKLSKYIDFNKILLKKDKTNNSIHFGFKNNIKIKELKNLITDLSKKYINPKKLSKLFNSEAKIAWISIGKNEISLYMRLVDWI